MIENETPQYALGVLIIAITIFYAAWYEYRRSNHRDAKLMLAAGLLTIAGTAVVFAALSQ